MIGMGRSAALLVLGVVAFAASCGTERGTRENDAATVPDDTAGKHGRVTLVRRLPLLDGDRLLLTAVEVTYGPGESSAPHRHRCPVFGYVADGALRFRVRGNEGVVYEAGDSFYERPFSDHLVSANASDTEPVRFVAHFVCDDPGPRTVPVDE